MKKILLYILFIQIIGFYGCNSINDINKKDEAMLYTDRINSVENDDSIPAESTGIDMTDNHLYSNLASCGRIYDGGEIIYYANVYDEMKLYAYIISDKTTKCLTDEVWRVSFINDYDNYIYFSAIPRGEKNEYGNEYNIYRLSDYGKLELLLESAEVSIIYDGILFYYGLNDAFTTNVSSYNLCTGKSHVIFDDSYNIGALVMNIVGDSLYCYNDTEIYKYDINTEKITCLTDGFFVDKEKAYGINKLVSCGGYLYTYTYGQDSGIYRLDTNTNTIEKIVTYNGGNFWFDVLLVDEESIIFTGRQNDALRPDQNEDEFVYGTYRYDFSDKSITKIYQPLSGTLYMIKDYLIKSFTYEDDGFIDYVIIDRYGQDMSKELSF